MIRDGRLKWIINVNEQREELYDLEADPAERRNLVFERPDEAARLRKVWAEWEDDAGCRR